MDARSRKQRNPARCRSRRHADCDRPFVGRTVPAAAQEPALSVHGAGLADVGPGAAEAGDRRARRHRSGRPALPRGAGRAVARGARGRPPHRAGHRHAAQIRRRDRRASRRVRRRACDRRPPQFHVGEEMRRAGRRLWRRRLRLCRQQPPRPRLLRRGARGDRRCARPPRGALADRARVGTVRDAEADASRPI